MKQVSASTWKRLEKLESAKKSVKPVGAWPDIIYDCDEWSAIAEPMQAKLLQGHAGRKS